MLSREDFIFTIGYDGPAAIVDGQAKRKFASLSTKELAEKGLFRAAYSSAIYSKDPAELDLVIAAYNAAAHTNYDRSFPFDRLFGVFPVEVSKVVVL
ncbi:MAG: hypothetical protein LDL24_08555 [Treponema sp.]|nr:hypothetical protein [Treponema sp.]